MNTTTPKERKDLNDFILSKRDFSPMVVIMFLVVFMVIGYFVGLVALDRDIAYQCEKLRSQQEEFPTTFTWTQTEWSICNQ